MDFNNKVFLIVSASSGMGRVVSRKLSEKGAKLVITARSSVKLDSLSLEEEISLNGAECLSVVGDALEEDSAQHVVDLAIEKFGRIDCVLLNAGGAPAIDMRNMNANEVKFYMRSNYDVTVNYLFPVLEQMKKQQSGLVVHTNSLAGFLGIPLQGPYSAAKGATRLLIDTCRLEFAGFGIKFINLYPGFIATEITKNDGMDAPLEISEEKAAEHILYALKKEKNNYSFPFTMGALVKVALILPQSFVNFILKRDVPNISN